MIKKNRKSLLKRIINMNIGTEEMSIKANYTMPAKSLSNFGSKRLIEKTC